MKTVDWRLLVPASWLLISLGACVAFGVFSYSRSTANVAALLFMSWYLFAPAGILCSVAGIIGSAMKMSAGWKKVVSLSIYLLALALSSVITYALIRWGGGIQQT